MKSPKCQGLYLRGGRLKARSQTRPRYFEQRGIAALSSDWLRLVLADDVNEQRFQKWIFMALRYLLRMRLRLGRPVTYIDATNLTRPERRQYIQIAQQFGCEVDAIYFDVPLEVCLERNRSRARRVPEDAMLRLAERLAPPSAEEGFCSITTVCAEAQVRGIPGPPS